jgi:hypothetical protein
MSTVFEGILCIVAFEDAISISSQISSSLKLKVEKINNYLSAIFRDENRKSLIFSPEIEYIASKISVAFSQALVVRYDDRVGYRATILFQNGVPSKSFDLADEIWVITDERGEPIVNGEKLTTDQIKDDEEYETIENAIQLGLNAFGINNWSEVHSFITRPYI